MKNQHPVKKPTKPHDLLFPLERNTRQRMLVAHRAGVAERIVERNKKVLPLSNATLLFRAFLKVLLAN